MAFFSCIVIFFTVGNKKHRRQQQCRQLRSHDADPYTIQLPHQRQQQHRRHLTNQCADEGDQRRDQSIVQSGKQGAAENVEAAKQK